MNEEFTQIDIKELTSETPGTLQQYATIVAAAAYSSKDAKILAKWVILLLIERCTVQARAERERLSVQHENALSRFAASARNGEVDMQLREPASRMHEAFTRMATATAAETRALEMCLRLVKNDFAGKQQVLDLIDGLGKLSAKGLWALRARPPGRRASSACLSASAAGSQPSARGARPVGVRRAAPRSRTAGTSTRRTKRSFG